MIDTEEMVKKAIAAYKAGKKSQARDLLTQVVDVDERNEQGWLYLSLVVDSLEEQELCLENVLSINPTNAQARKAIEVIRKKQGKPPLGDQHPAGGGKVASTPPAPTNDPWDGADTAWGDLGASGGRGGDSWSTVLENDANPWGTPSTPQPPTSSSASSPWDSGAWEVPPPSPPTSPSPTASPWDSNDDTGWFSDAPATSVEWGQNDSAGGGYHGSGQSVGAPSSTELDSWISGLNLGKDSPESGTQGGNAPPPSSDWSSGWEQMGGASAGGGAIENASPFKVDDLGAGAVAKPEAYLKPEPQQPTPSKAASSKASLPPTPSRSRYADEDEDDDEEEGYGYGEIKFGDEAKTTDSLFKAGFLEDEDEDEYAELFALIPEEIQAAAQSKAKSKPQSSGGGSLVAVVILSLLNLAALAGLVFNLMS